MPIKQMPSICYMKRDLIFNITSIFSISWILLIKKYDLNFVDIMVSCFNKVFFSGEICFTKWLLDEISTHRL
jgi:hypothetical protein